MQQILSEQYQLTDVICIPGKTSYDKITYAGQPQSISPHAARCAPLNTSLCCALSTILVMILATSNSWLFNDSASFTTNLAILLGV